MTYVQTFSKFKHIEQIVLAAITKAILRGTFLGIPNGSPTRVHHGKSHNGGPTVRFLVRLLMGIHYEESPSPSRGPRIGIPEAIP